MPRLSLGALTLLTLGFSGFLSNCQCQESGFTDLKGRITFKGDPIPKRELIEVVRDKECCLRGGPILTNNWVVNPKNRGVGWVMVWLDVDPKGKIKSLPLHTELAKAKEETVSLDITSCTFHPHLLALREGQKLQVRNLDPVIHVAVLNPSSGPNESFQRLIPSTQSFEIKLKAHSMPLKVECPIHPWMSSWIWVFPHPYFAVTDADGRFEIKNAPEGSWRLRAWHEETGWRGGRAGRFGQEIHIKKGPGADLGELLINP